MLNGTENEISFITSGHGVLLDLFMCVQTKICFGLCSGVPTFWERAFQ